MDYSQKGLITTLHDFGQEIDWQKEMLEGLRRDCSIVIPMLYSEIRHPALKNILNHLNNCKYLDNVVVSLKAKSKEEFRNTAKFYKKRLSIPHTILWGNGPRINKILKGIKKENIHVLDLSGKGRDMWLALGVASVDSYAIGLIDADVTTFTDALPTKLLFPVMSPELDFFFNKAYYTRIGAKEMKMYGRVFRLFVSPLIDSLKRKLGRRSPFLEYLDSFKYALSGEFSLTSDLALNIRFPGDWGVEIGILTEVFRSASLKRVCQTDMGFHDHKHRKIGDREIGLVKMAGDIEKCLLRTLVEMEGVDVSKPFLESLQVLYGRLGEDYIHSYSGDSFFNTLAYDRHEEEIILRTF
ncbi:MAG: glucosyl-3-phosphoglycerate synthase, partial [Candidatus Hydrothermarchaeales archaeon]